MPPAGTPQGRIDHIGIVVDDLAGATKFLADAFGLTIDRELDLAERRLRVAFLTFGDVSLELIEVDDPEQRRERLGEGNKARIEHIAVETSDLETRIAHLHALGVHTRPDAPRRTGSTLNVWTDPSTSGGVIYQVFTRLENEESPAS